MAWSHENHSHSTLTGIDFITEPGLIHKDGVFVGHLSIQKMKPQEWQALPRHGLRHLSGIKELFRLQLSTVYADFICFHDHRPHPFTKIGWGLGVVLIFLGFPNCSLRFWIAFLSICSLMLTYRASWRIWGLDIFSWSPGEFKLPAHLVPFWDESSLKNLVKMVSSMSGWEGSLQ